MQAMAGGGIVVVEHAVHEQRWPAYIARAVTTGLRPRMGLQLFNHRGTIGGLNLYSTDHDSIDPEALDTRQIIGQATGVIMERHGMTPKRAFAYLVHLSSHRNTKLRRRDRAA
jgi:hypothetical protein